MNESTPVQDPALLKAITEASVWISRIHGPDRSPSVERGLRHWLEESELHRQAFEHATDVWLKVRAKVRRSAIVHLSVPGEELEVPPKRRLPAAWMTSAVACLVVIVGILAYFHQPAVATGVGERRVLTLEDGTQVSMNTATRVIVDYDKRQRHVRLESGEALFHVAKRPDWPFVVTVGNRTVTALGTAFLIRRDRESVAVTLVEGKIAVSSSESGSATRKSLEELQKDVLADVITPAPGERLTFSPDVPAPKVDWPELDKLTAWQDGKIHIDNMMLPDAIAEMNRYNVVQLAVEGTKAEAIRVSGIFRVGDATNFANAVAITHGLQIRDDGRRLVLHGTPSPPDESRFGPDPR